MRKNVYWSERLDQDLVKYMDDNAFEKDFSQAIKKLMRDGIKFRKGETLYAISKNIPENPLPKPKSVMGDETPRPTVDFSDIEVEKKVVEITELDDRLNSI